MDNTEIVEEVDYIHNDGTISCNDEEINIDHVLDKTPSYGPQQKDSQRVRRTLLEGHKNVKIYRVFTDMSTKDGPSFEYVEVTETKLFFYRDKSYVFFVRNGIPVQVNENLHGYLNSSEKENETGLLKSGQCLTFAEALTKVLENKDTEQDRKKVFDDFTTQLEEAPDPKPSSIFSTFVFCCWFLMTCLVTMWWKEAWVTLGLPNHEPSINLSCMCVASFSLCVHAVCMISTKQDSFDHSRHSWFKLIPNIVSRSFAVTSKRFEPHMHKLTPRFWYWVPLVCAMSCLLCTFIVSLASCNELSKRKNVTKAWPMVKSDCVLTSVAFDSEKRFSSYVHFFTNMSSLEDPTEIRFYDKRQHFEDDEASKQLKEIPTSPQFVVVEWKEPDGSSKTILKFQSLTSFLQWYIMSIFQCSVLSLFLILMMLVHYTELFPSPGAKGKMIGEVMIYRCFVTSLKGCFPTQIFKVYAEVIGLSFLIQVVLDRYTKTVHEHVKKTARETSAEKNDDEEQIKLTELQRKLSELETSAEKNDDEEQIKLTELQRKLSELTESLGTRKDAQNARRFSV